MLNAPEAQRLCARSTRHDASCATLARAARSSALWRALAAGALALPLLACSPALDWRQAGPRSVDVLLDYPCKPQTVTQPVVLAGRHLDMSMTGCETAHMTFALAHADLGDASLVAPALAELRRAALANIDARVLQQQPSAVRQATAGLADAVELDLQGHAAGAGALREHVVLFARGAQVFQATVLGDAGHYQDDAAHTFASSVQLGGPAR